MDSQKSSDTPSPQVSSPPAGMLGPQMGGGGVVYIAIGLSVGGFESRNSFAAGQTIANFYAGVHGIPEILGHFVSSSPLNLTKF